MRGRPRRLQLSHARSALAAVTNIAWLEEYDPRLLERPLKCLKRACPRIGGANLIKITDVTGHRSLEMLKTYSRDTEAFVGHAGARLL